MSEHHHQPSMLYPSCPKCEGIMEEGFFLDKTHGGYASVKWVEGEPRRSIWTGLKIGDQRKLCIITYRCLDCGYLESYARKEPG